MQYFEKERVVQVNIANKEFRKHDLWKYLEIWNQSGRKYY